MRLLPPALALALCAAVPAASANEIDLSEERATFLAAAIQANGLRCPIAKTWFYQRETARGILTSVRCGPDDGTDNVFSDYRYDFLIGDDDTVKVTEVDCTGGLLGTATC